MNKNEVIKNAVMALCELGIGILLLVDPVGFTVWIFITLGIVLMAMGLIEIVSYFRSEPAGVLKRRNQRPAVSCIRGGDPCQSIHFHCGALDICGGFADCGSNFGHRGFDFQEKEGGLDGYTGFLFWDQNGSPFNL